MLERVQGVSLQEHFDRRAAAGQPFSIGEALDLLLMLAEGLSVIHRAGISHRDVKPGNIMLAPGHRFVLMDFGLGRPERGGGPETFGGTPTYMAPEVILQSVQEGGVELSMYLHGTGEGQRWYDRRRERERVGVGRTAPRSARGHPLCGQGPGARGAADHPPPRARTPHAR